LSKDCGARLHAAILRAGWRRGRIVASVVRREAAATGGSDGDWSTETAPVAEHDGARSRRRRRSWGCQRRRRSCHRLTYPREPRRSTGESEIDHLNACKPFGSVFGDLHYDRLTSRSSRSSRMTT